MKIWILRLKTLFGCGQKGENEGVKTEKRRHSNRKVKEDFLRPSFGGVELAGGATPERTEPRAFLLQKDQERKNNRNNYLNGSGNRAHGKK